MIIVGSSALIAVLFEGPEKQAFQDIIDGDERCVLSAVHAHETACVLRGRRGVVAVAEFWQWLADNEIEIVPFDEVQVHAAAIAFDRYGKGIHARERLNLADCASRSNGHEANSGGGGRNLPCASGRGQGMNSKTCPHVSCREVVALEQQGRVHGRTHQ
jgi:ribonuclease VapC